MRRLSLSLLVFVLVAVIGLGWFLDRVFLIFGEPEQDLLAPYRLLGQNLITNFDSRDELETALLHWEMDEGASIFVIDRDELSLPDTLDDALSTGDALVIESETGVSLYFSKPAWTYALAIATAPDRSRVLSLQLLLTILFYAGIILLMLLWLYPLLRRLASLRGAAKQFGEGYLERRVQTHRYSYLHDIETEFNRMASRIQGLVSDNKLLSNAVSHDLRTPLARLRFGIDALEEEQSAETQAQYMSRISDDLSEMEKLVEVLLDYARLDQGLSRPVLESISLSNLISSRVDVIRPHTAATIVWEPPSKAFAINAHPRYLEMLINNLIQNAVAYCESKVVISLHVDRGRTWFSVADDGPGIRKADRDAVVKPFARGSVDATQGNPKGFGMGLAIVQRIAESHDALLLIEESTELGGAQLRVGFLAN